MCASRLREVTVLRQEFHLGAGVSLEGRQQAQARGELADGGGLQELLRRHRQRAQPRLPLLRRQRVRRVGEWLLNQQLQQVEPGPIGAWTRSLCSLLVLYCLPAVH
jgi:hypothetical protein